jgi:hypothetical protein
MSQPIFDPLDAAVLTGGFVPWAATVLAEEAGRQRQELLQRTSDADAWNWVQVTDPGELTLLAREARREYVATSVKGLFARIAAAFHRIVPVHADVGLPRGRHA